MPGVRTAPTFTTPQVVLWRPDGFAGLELERLDRGRRAPVPQMLGEHCVTVCTEGAAVAHYRGELHPLYDRRARGYGAGEAYAAGPPRGGTWSYRTLRIAPDLLRDLARAARAPLPSAVPLAPPDETASRCLSVSLSAAFTAFEAVRPACDAEEALVGVVRAWLARPVPPRAPPPASERARRAVAAAREVLDLHRAEVVTLDRLADEVGMSKHHLNRTFRRIVGTTPQVFQTSLRIAAAKRLLRGDGPIAQIALGLGFADQAHFTRTFRRYVGVPPGRYRAPERTIVQDGNAAAV